MKLKDWRDQLLPDIFSYVEKDVMFPMIDDPDMFEAYIYTDKYRYFITAQGPSKAYPNGYLGCIISEKDPPYRGNDLSDGKLDPVTWYHIVCDIVSCELVPFELEDIEAVSPERVI